MKKNITLALIFIFAFSLALYLPARAEEATTTGSGHETATTTPSSNDNADILPLDLDAIGAGEVKPTSTPLTHIDTSKLEKIPSPDYLKYFRDILKKDGVLYGIRINRNETSTAQQIKKDERKATSSLEKIPSPAHINLFEKITKIGNSLFGIKKSGEIKKADDVKKPEKNDTANLEKITSLDQVKLFDKITKIGNDLFGLRKNPIKQLPVMSTSTITCVSNAIDTKDTAISTAFTKAASDITTAMSTRGTCQKAALAMAQNERHPAIAKCNQTFQEASKKAHETSNTTQKETWNVYRADLKVCSSSNEGTTSEIMIEDGGQNTNNLLAQ